MRGWVVREPTHRYVMLRKGIGPIYAGKGGRLLLKTEVRWYHFSGIWINTKRGCWWLHFRRAL
jgi:hypothetical protein